MSGPQKYITDKMQPAAILTQAVKIVSVFFDMLRYGEDKT